jgi:ankyrin repeat protein
MGDIPYNLYRYIENTKISLDELKKLITKENINDKYYYNYGSDYSILHAVCIGPNAEIDKIQYILSLGIDININSESHNIPLHWLCKNKYNLLTINLLEFMLSHGANINQCGGYHRDMQTPVHNLIFNNMFTINMFKAVLKYKPDFNIKNYGDTQIYWLWYTLGNKETMNTETLEWITTIFDYADTSTWTWYELFGLFRSKALNVKVIKLLLLYNLKMKRYNSDYIFTKLAKNQSNYEILLQNGVTPNKWNDLSHANTCKKFITSTQLLRYTICGPIILEEILSAF